MGFSQAGLPAPAPLLLVQPLRLTHTPLPQLGGGGDQAGGLQADLAEVAHGADLARAIGLEARLGVGVLHKL